MSIGGVAACALVLSSCAASGQELSLLGRVRQRLAAEAQRIPNYTCTERITRSRFAGKTRKLVNADRVRLEVAYVDGKELFAWPGEPFQHRDPGILIGSGMSGTGDFATVLLNIFLTDPVTYGTAEREVFNGQKAVRFSYWISEPVWRLKFNSAEASVRYRGSFWISTETERLLAIEAEAEDIPEALRISGIKTRIELQQVAINGSEVTLPRSTLLTSFPASVGSDIEETNRTEFENCRHYTADSTISFGEEEGGVSAASASDPAEQLRELPPGIRVRTALDPPIDASTSAAGDAISATVIKAVHEGPVRIPKGARLRGRLLFLQIDAESVRVMATLDFPRIEAAGLRFLFRGHLRSLHWRPGLLQPGQLRADFRREVPEALTLQMRNGLLRIPKGVEMEWVTGQPAEP